MKNYTKELLQEYIKMTLNINNEYQDNGFVEYNKTLLQITKYHLISCLDAHKHLYSVSKDEKSVVFGIKLINLMLLRISYLYHKGRCENEIELQNSINSFNQMYNQG